jgi:hypothetical protein
MTHLRQIARMGVATRWDIKHGSSPCRYRPGRAMVSPLVSPDHILDRDANLGGLPPEDPCFSLPVVQDWPCITALPPGIVNLLSDLSRSHPVCDTRHMNTPSTNRYKHHRFPAEIISHGVWLYFRFCLSYRDVEELLLARGIIVTYEAIRKWCLKFGQAYANQLRRRRPRPGDKWHLDEVFLTINGARHYLWRAVDQDGHILDILVQSCRNKQAAKKFW